jgi:anthranilate/para-aminobenzoate synthase component I
VRGYIAAGDIYQANLTFPLQAVTATPSAVFFAMPCPNCSRSNLVPS